jgi:hypothetical protein
MLEVFFLIPCLSYIITNHYVIKYVKNQLIMAINIMIFNVPKMDLENISSNLMHNGSANC